MSNKEKFRYVYPFMYFAVNNGARMDIRIQLPPDKETLTPEQIQKHPHGDFKLDQRRVIEMIEKKKKGATKLFALINEKWNLEAARLHNKHINSIIARREEEKARKKALADTGQTT